MKKDPLDRIATKEVAMVLLIYRDKSALGLGRRTERWSNILLESLDERKAVYLRYNGYCTSSAVFPGGQILLAETIVVMRYSSHALPSASYLRPYVLIQ